MGGTSGVLREIKSAFRYLREQIGTEQIGTEYDMATL